MTERPTFDAIFFDLDGTLVDTERAALTSGLRSFSQLGFADAHDLLHGLIGIDQPTARGKIRAAYPSIDLDALHGLWAEEFEATLREGVPLKQGVHPLVPRLAERFRLGLVTSSGRESALDRITRSALAPSFQLVVAREDVTHPKPSSEPYLLAARKLGVDPARCLVFEDSEPGTQSAHAAGMTVVHIPDMIPASGRYSHHIAPDLAAGLAWAGLLM